MTAVTRLGPMAWALCAALLVMLRPGLPGVDQAGSSAAKATTAGSAGPALSALSVSARALAGPRGSPCHFESTPASSAHPTRQESRSTTPASLADFAWLEGRWRGDWGPRVAEQVWMASKAGLMLGTFRLVEDNKTLLIELFSLLQKPDGIEFRFRHFTPDLAPWEKSDATLLTLESSDGRRFVFVNAMNGQPKRAILTRLDADRYVSRSEILPDSGGLEAIEITYHRERTGATGGAFPRAGSSPARMTLTSK